MANNAGNNLEYWLSVTTVHRSAIYELRKWAHLKMSVEDNLIWIRGFSLAEIDSSTVLKIPFIMRYYLSGAHLVPHGKTLPAMVEPNLLWSPIQRGFKISLPNENYNYFGLDQTFQLSLVPCKEVKRINVTIVELKTLENYIHSTYNVRLKNLKWTILENDKALIIGTPILPVRGQDLYQNASFLLPAGWKLKYENLIKVYKRALGESIDYWYYVNEKSHISKLRKSDFNLLSKGSLISTLS